MLYKWRPSKTAKKQFAQRMQDPTEAAAYEARKAQRAENRRAGSSFDYNTAGGNYVPTQAQYNAAFDAVKSNLSPEQVNACNIVMYGYTCNEKVHHDYIHVVNELIRNTPKQ